MAGMLRPRCRGLRRIVGSCLHTTLHCTATLLCCCSRHVTRHTSPPCVQHTSPLTLRFEYCCLTRRLEGGSKGHHYYQPSHPAHTYSVLNRRFRASQATFSNGSFNFSYLMVTCYSYVLFATLACL